MAASSSDSLPAWRNDILSQLKSRNATVGRSFSRLVDQRPPPRQTPTFAFLLGVVEKLVESLVFELTFSDNLWMEREKALRAENKTLITQNEIIQRRAEELESLLKQQQQQKGGGSVMDPLDIERMRKLQEELNGASKLNSELAKQVLEINEQLKKATEVQSQRAFEASELKTILEKSQARSSRLTDELNDKLRVLDLVRAELLQLQTDLVKSEDHVKELTRENKSLLDRYMKKVDEDVTKVSEANKFFSEMKASHSASGSTPNLNMGATSLDPDDFHEVEKPNSPGSVTLPAASKRYFEGSNTELNAVCFSPNGSLFVTGGTDKVLKVYESFQGALKTQLMGADRTVMSVAVSPDNELVMAASNDNATRVWSLDVGRIKHSLLGHIGKVFAAKFTYDSQRAVTGSHDRSLKVWDLQRGVCQRTIFCHSSCNDLALTNQADMIISGHLDNHLRFWDAKNGDMVHDLATLHTGQITSVTTSPDGQTVLTNSRDNTLKIVDIRTCEVLHTLKDDAQYKNALNWTRAAWSPDGRWVAAGSVDGTLCIWNAYNGKIERSYKKPHQASITCVDWGFNGNLATVDRSGWISLW